MKLINIGNIGRVLELYDNKEISIEKMVNMLNEIALRNLAYEKLLRKELKLNRKVLKDRINREFKKPFP